MATEVWTMFDEGSGELVVGSVTVSLTFLVLLRDVVASEEVMGTAGALAGETCRLARVEGALSPSMVPTTDL